MHQDRRPQGLRCRCANRAYRAGPILRPAEMSSAPVARIRELALPHLRRLVLEVNETAQLQVLAGDEVRFVASVECTQVLRAGDRVGQVVPAHLGSGGKAMLARLPTERLTDLYESSEVDLGRLRHELNLVRRRGFAINDQKTEKGLSAVGMAVVGPDGSPVAAVSLSIPSARFGRDEVRGWVGALAVTVGAVQEDLSRVWAA